jgi:predicted GH43/DUF377 family glycosyl hydrolase
MAKPCFSSTSEAFRITALVIFLMICAFLIGADPGALPSRTLTRFSGNPLLRNGPELYDLGKTGPRVVMKDDSGHYRMWYEAVAGNGLTTVAYATSADGLTWKKRGVVLSPSAAWEMEELSPNTVLFEGGVFKLWYHGGGYIRGKRRLGHARIGYATSKDGVVWTKYPGNPVLDIGPRGSFDDNQVAEPRVLRVGNAYRMYYTGQAGSSDRTSLGLATSSDGIQWKKSGPNAILDQERWGGWGGAFIPENGIFHLWHAAPKSGRPGLVYKWSRDGINWNDGPLTRVLEPNPDPQAPDHSSVGDSVSGYRGGDTYRIMYTGYSANLFGKLGRFEGICLATIAAERR